MTLNGVKRRVISPNLVAFGADYVKVVEDTPTKGRQKPGDGKGVSYPGPRSVGGAPRFLRMIFLSPFTGNTKADNSKFFN